MKKRSKNVRRKVTSKIQSDNSYMHSLYGGKSLFWDEHQCCRKMSIFSLAVTYTTDIRSFLPGPLY